MYRSQCTCHCHTPGMKVKHMVACCRADPVLCGQDMGTQVWWKKDEDNNCVCLLEPNHNGDHMCRHDLDDAA